MFIELRSSDYLGPHHERSQWQKGHNSYQGSDLKSNYLLLLLEIQTLLLLSSIILAALIAKLIYLDFYLNASEASSFYIGSGILAAIVWSLVASRSELNHPSAIISGEMMPLVIIKTVTTCFMTLVGILYLLKMSDQVSRCWFVLWYLLSISFFLLSRRGILVWASRQKNKNHVISRIGVYGSADLAERVIDNLTAEDAGLSVVGVFSDDTTVSDVIPISGGMQTLIEMVQQGICNHVVLALPSQADNKIHHAMTSLHILPIGVQLCPDAMTVPFFSGEGQNLSAPVLIDLQRPPLNPKGLIVKAVMDYVLGALALALFAPAMALIAIAIKYDSAGPVFFVQSRHGYNHRIIRVMKFRTMTVVEDGPVVTQAVRGDKRVTRVGRFLRRTSLDEMPQLINVMRGELSLVGPRPHAVAHNEAYARNLSSYAARHKVKPGITGLAQVNGFRGETTTPEAMRQRVDFDLHYIRNWSPWLDLKIIMRTALVPFYSPNAY